MSVSLTAEREREARAVRERERMRESRSALPGADLMRYVHGAVRATCVGKVKVSESEREALAACVALDVLTAHRDRIARMSESDRESRQTLALMRSDVGRSYLQSAVRYRLSSRDWRDSLDGYRTRSERERGLAGLAAGSLDAVSDASESADESEDRSRLRSRVLPLHEQITRAESRESEPVAVPSDSLAVLADSLTARALDRLADRNVSLTARQSEGVAVALRSACGYSLAEQASEPGALSLRTLASRSAEGVAVLALTTPASSLRRMLRESADESREDRLDDYRLRRAVRGAVLSPVAESARESVERAATVERERAGYRQSPALLWRDRIEPDGSVAVAGALAGRLSVRLSAPYGPRVARTVPLPSGRTFRWDRPTVARYREPVSHVLAPVACALCGVRPADESREQGYRSHAGYPSGLHPSHPRHWPDSLMAGMPVYSRSHSAR